MQLEVQCIEKEGRYNLLLNGEIDVYTSEKLKEALYPLTNKEGVEIIINLSQINYIDSTGLGVFIGALKMAAKHESSIKLTGMIERVRRLFQITGLDEVIDIEESVREEAK